MVLQRRGILTQKQQTFPTQATASGKERMSQIKIKLVFTSDRSKSIIACPYCTTTALHCWLTTPRAPMAWLIMVITVCKYGVSNNQHEQFNNIPMNLRQSTGHILWINTLYRNLIFQRLHAKFVV